MKLVYLIDSGENSIVLLHTGVSEWELEEVVC